MALSPAPERLFRPFPHRQPWPRRVFASSVALHALGFALAGWGTHVKFRTLISTSPQHVTRAYAVHYLVLTRPPIRPAPRPPRPPRSVASATPPGNVNVVDSASQSTPPRRPALQAEALVDSTGGRGPAGMLGLQVSTTSVGQARRGLDRVVELVGGAGSACPELRPPAAWNRRVFAVAVAFDVDTNGAVDPATLRVIESPGRPQTDHRFHARIYVVGASVRVDPGRIPAAAYDSVLTEEMASHVAGLMFRPALREGLPIRSTVLVSCQTS
jgi:hypothetical protein